MRWLMWFAIGVGTGCAVGAYLFRGMGLVVLAVLCLLGLIPAVRLSKRLKQAMIGIAVLLGIAAGCTEAQGKPQ